MKKLRLEVDELAVESFATVAGMGQAGTVEAFGTQFGNTCGAVRTCGPQTCGDLICVLDTNGCGGGSAGCSVGCPTVGCPVSGQLSCVGCTTYDYTANAADDSCGFCQSFGSDVPQRCPCI